MGFGRLTHEDPRRLGRYRIHARVGAGGMGVVYLAFDRRRRPVAVKTLRPDVAGSPSFRTRFCREIEAARRIDAECTARFIDCDPDSDPPYFVTEFVPAPTLEAFVAQHGALRGDVFHAFAAGIAGALAAIHSVGLVHRDLKPANVLITPGGPKVIDFGIARGDDNDTLTLAGQLVGSPKWMAPEQLLFEPITSATDVFAWGALVAFAGTGVPPFGVGDYEAVLSRVIHEDPNLAGLEPSIEALVARALAKVPEQRPSIDTLLEQLVGSAEPDVAGWHREVGELLERSWTPAVHIDAPSIPSRRSLQQLRGGHRSVFRIAAVVVAIAVVAISAIVLITHRSPRRNRVARPTRPTAAASVLNQSAAKTITPPTTAPPDTKIVTTALFAPGGGPAPSIHITKRTPGSCNPSNNSARADAYRCYVTAPSVTNIYDPCFSDGFSTSVVLCQPNPTGSDAIEVHFTDTFTPSARPPSADIHASNPWFLALANGQQCLLAAGAASATVADLKENYVCNSPTLPSGVVYGNPKRTQGAWTVMYQGQSDATMAPVVVTTAYY